MTAGGRPLDVLLAVQAHDTEVDRLRHRRRTLPERAALAAVEQQLADLAATRAEVAAKRDEVAARQTDFERDLSATETRITTLERRLYSGEVSATRDLLAMTAEVESLRGRVSSLEDQVLAAMDECEPLDAELDRLEGERQALDARKRDLRAAIAEAEVAIDGEIADEGGRRSGLAGGLPADLMATYERLRSRLDGVGAARLEHGSCTGCHLTLPAVELDRLRKLDPDAVVYCDQCGRILVR